MEKDRRGKQRFQQDMVATISLRIKPRLGKYSKKIVPIQPPPPAHACVVRNISSLGMWVTGKEMPVGSKVTVKALWPIMLGGLTPLCLVIHGTVVRSTPEGFAVRRDYSRGHEFVTANSLFLAVAS